MRARTGLLLCIAVVGLATFTAIEPRLHHPFPSMIDDWSAILKAPHQLREVLALGNPERQRYRPGFIAWNALQWHTLGAPTEFLGPQLWNLARVAMLVLGITAIAATLIPAQGRSGPIGDRRWFLVAGAALAVITTPSIAVDLARYGPQEPLLVGCMALGAAVLVRAFDRLLDPTAPSAATYLATLAGLAVWFFGVLQKETSICVLLLIPFLWPTIRGQRDRWRQLGAHRRVLVGVVGATVLLPFVPMVAWTIKLSRADSRVYESFAANRSFSTRFWDQISNADVHLNSPIFDVLAVAATVALVLAFRRADWLAVGLLVCALAFVLFAAESGVVASRYFLPPLTLIAIAIARVVVTLGAKVVVAAGLVLLFSGMAQAREGRAWVESSVDGERDQEALVRSAAALVAGGCEVSVTGQDVELVVALPVLMPLADEAPRICKPPERYVVVIDGNMGHVTPPEDPTLSRCVPEPTPVWRSPLATISRCTL